EQHLRAQHVGPDEDFGAQDRAVDVALRSEVEDALDPVLLEQCLDPLPVPVVSADEDVPRVPLQVAQVLEVPGVGEKVEVDHRPVRALLAQVPDEVRTDEATTTSDEA